ncbi:GNAT family N-acetyltransferase [Defluviimonas sp. SAOS-178_SWC]|uniref:GNAT family N-acetyltransferase n=1 Tax=Defluviimonas sp. SAOS-178_SWC TaxID=3121287 RepID=UPI003221CB68
MILRPAAPADDDRLWAILEPVFREGETYCLPRDITRADALDYWSAVPHLVFVAEDAGDIVGSYFLTPNQKGGGAHVCNCGFVTAPAARGRGVARAMLAHAVETARAEGYLAMQFNFVVSTNERAIAIWRDMGFDIVGRLPDAFRSPKDGYVDALVMYRTL